ncbi:hypothetical protein [Bdellovibrio bacteriovorus]|uniref:hypothetical protein n=1 Tax=Bdellovibrio TaxID=958 RepID=UPI0035A8D8CF
MKKLLMSAMMIVSLVGSTAFAFEGVLHQNKKGNFEIVPLHQNCDDVGPQPTTDHVACPVQNEGCPPWTEPVAKYCWGGWGTGFYRCGFACHKVADGGKDDRGGHHGGRGGHHGGHGGNHDGGGRGN